MYDYTIVGAGYGGLSAAALLSQREKKFFWLKWQKILAGDSGINV